MLEKVSAALDTTPTTIPQTPHISKNPQKQKKKKLKKESCPAGENLHSKRLWMLEKVSAALNTTPLLSHKLLTFPKIPLI